MEVGAHPLNHEPSWSGPLIHAVFSRMHGEAGGSLRTPAKQPPSCRVPHQEGPAQLILGPMFAVTRTKGPRRGLTAYPERSRGLPDLSATRLSGQEPGQAPSVWSGPIE